MVKSPIGPCVRVHWDNSVEFVPIHPQHRRQISFETIEYWRESDRWIEYSPLIKQYGMGRATRYEITYAPENHPDLKKSDVIWGTSRIVIGEPPFPGLFNASECLH